MQDRIGQMRLTAYAINSSLYLSSCAAPPARIALLQTLPSPSALLLRWWAVGSVLRTEQASHSACADPRRKL